MPSTAIRLELWIEPGSDPIKGWVVRPDGTKLRFAGWVELTAAIEAVRAGGNA